MQAARPRLLLYEKGKDVLEPIVRGTLRALCARIDDPEEEDSEDGRVFAMGGGPSSRSRAAPGRSAWTTSAKPFSGHATLTKGKEGQEYMPLIVGNPDCDKRPEERGDVLGPRAETYARNMDVALVTTLQVFEALRQKQAGTFDEGRFWRIVFDTAGAADLEEPTTA